MIQSLVDLDRFFFLVLNSFHNEWLNSFMVVLSGQVIWVPLIIFCVWAAQKEYGQKGALLFMLFLALAIIASDVTASYIIKNYFERLRPCREVDLKPLIYNFGQRCGGRFGFVSSHAANSFALILFSMLTLGTKAKILHFVWPLVILVNFSRIYLGVHYPGDILGGALVGILWGAIMAWIFCHSDFLGSKAR